MIEFDKTEVNSAVFADGVLTIELINVIPESNKPQNIPISSGKQLLSE